MIADAIKEARTSNFFMYQLSQDRYVFEGVCSSSK
jgi:hypothetical protein